MSRSATTTSIGGPKVSLWTSGSIASEIVLDADVVGFQTNKTMGAASGTWSLDLFPRISHTYGAAGDIRRQSLLYQAIRPNNVVSIGFNERGGIMAGLVDRCRKVRVFSGGQVSYALRVSGRDFGKALEVDNITLSSVASPDAPAFISGITAAYGENHPLIKALLGTWGPLEAGVSREEAVNTFLNRNVKDVVDWILQNAGTLVLPLLTECGVATGKIAEFIDTSFCVTTWNDGRLFNEGLQSYQGSIWGFIQAALDMDFYECWIDTIPFGRSSLPQAVLIIRPKPFDEKALEFLPVTEDPGISWESLTTMLGDPTIDSAQGRQKEHWEIAEGDVTEEDLGFGDDDAYSFYQVTSQNELIGNEDGIKEGLIYPAIDTFNGKRFGNRAYNARLSLVAGDMAQKIASETDYDGELPPIIKEFRNRLVNWNRLNTYMENGSISVHGFDRFRVGDPIKLPYALAPNGFTTGMRFYCTGVSQSWRAGGPYTSGLTLVRGHNDEMVTAAKIEIATDTPPSSLTKIVET